MQKDFKVACNYKGYITRYFETPNSQTANPLGNRNVGMFFLDLPPCENAIV
jgi:hypothetical protein